MSLTEKQEAILRFIGTYQADSGRIPTLREIQKHFGFASSFAANRHIMALEKKGALVRGEGLARSITLKNRPALGLRIPFLGAISAGLPLDVIQEEERYFEFNAETLGIRNPGDVFALLVRGDSMEGAHILDGDVAILERKPAAHGDIVAALIDGETTLKRLIIKDGEAHLQAENARYPDLVPINELHIQGVLRTVVRSAPNRP